MNCGTYRSSLAVPEDDVHEHEMPAQLSFDWNPSAVASFLHKLNTVNKEGIDFPQCFGPFHPSPEGMKTFQFELLKIVSSTISGVVILGEYNGVTVEANDYSSLSKLIARLIALPSVPWVKAVLQHDEPLQNKLFKLTISVRGEPHDIIDFEHPLIH